MDALTSDSMDSRVKKRRMVKELDNLQNILTDMGTMVDWASMEKSREWYMTCDCYVYVELYLFD